MFLEVNVKLCTSEYNKGVVDPAKIEGDFTVKLFNIAMISEMEPLDDEHCIIRHFVGSYVKVYLIDQSYNDLSAEIAALDEVAEDGK